MTDKRMTLRALVPARQHGTEPKAKSGTTAALAVSAAIVMVLADTVFITAMTGWPAVASGISAVMLTFLGLPACALGVKYANTKARNRTTTNPASTAVPMVLAITSAVIAVIAVAAVSTGQPAIVTGAGTAGLMIYLGISAGGLGRYGGMAAGKVTVPDLR